MSFRNLAEAFAYQIQCRPDAVAMTVELSTDNLRPIPWRQLASVVATAAGNLSARFNADPSLPRRIGHASDNSFVDVVIALASMSIGAVEVPLDHRLSEQEIQKRWNIVGGLWLDQTDRQRLKSDVQNGLWRNNWNPAIHASRNFDVDAPSLILWTSGTTGTPRGVTLSQRNLVGNAAAKLRAVPERPDDIRLCVLPLAHAYARTCDLATWLLSGCSLTTTLGINGLRRLAPQIRPTIINTVPHLANRLLAEDPAQTGLDRLQLLGCGGAAISASTFDRWKERGVTVIQGYGLTEGSPVVCSASSDDAAPGLVGHFVEGWESDIRDGHLYVRGPHTMLGYWEDEGATAKKIDTEGWLDTGDMVREDPSTGQVQILGRADEVIVLDSARKLFPSTVEREVERIAGVHHAFLIHNGHLQLWFDADEDCDHEKIAGEIGQLLAEQFQCRDCGVHQFTPPLTASEDELTDKGTIRRARIRENRFAGQAGS